MRDVSEEIKGCQTLCWVWRVTFKDESVLGFTDHDRALIFQDLGCDPSSGFAPGDDQNVEGLLNSDLITAEDIRAGKFDGAQIDRFRVNWNDPSEFVHMATGYLGAITQKGGRFEAEWLGQASRLERSTGRVFARVCDADFGDKRCGLDASAFPNGTICARTFSVCRDQFSNTLNFRGFPYILGDDALTAGAQEGDLRDGGSRYS